MRDSFKSGENSSPREEGKNIIWLEGVLFYSNEQNFRLPLEKVMHLKVIYNLC